MDNEYSDLIQYQIQCRRFCSELYAKHSLRHRRILAAKQWAFTIKQIGSMNGQYKIKKNLDASLEFNFSISNKAAMASPLNDYLKCFQQSITNRPIRYAFNPALLLEEQTESFVEGNKIYLDPYTFCLPEFNPTLKHELMHIEIDAKQSLKYASADVWEAQIDMPRLQRHWIGLDLPIEYKDYLSFSESQCYIVEIQEHLAQYNNFLTSSEKMKNRGLLNLVKHASKILFFLHAITSLYRKQLINKETFNSMNLEFRLRGCQSRLLATNEPSPLLTIQHRKTQNMTSLLLHLERFYRSNYKRLKWLMELRTSLESSTALTEFTKLPWIESSQQSFRTNRAMTDFQTPTL